VAGDPELVEALRYACPGLIYSTALTPASAAGTLAALEIVRNEFDRLGARMWRNHTALIGFLKEQGYSLGQGTAPIAAVLSGSTAETIALAKDFYARQILATPFVPPSVPQGKGVLRCILGAKFGGLALEDLHQALRRTGTVKCDPCEVVLADSLTV
jgi:8-amino-7-oxononanoate synthase